MIELRKNSQLEGFYQLFIDGHLIKTASPLYSTGGPDKIKISHIRVNVEDTEKVASKRFFEIPASVKNIILTYWFSWSELPFEIEIRRNARQVFEIEITFISYVSWRGAYSLADYFRELRQVIIEAESPHIIAGSEFPHNIVFLDIPPETNIADEIARCSDILSGFHKEAKRRLASRLPGESVAMMFDFPEEVRVPCEQYLLYFAQFLKDLGVEANTALTHEAGQVLFTVTPDDKQQALDKIRTALEVYLHLPSSPVSDPQQSEIAILRLNSQLQHFQSQLSLARAEIQMKEAAIQLQKVTITQLSGEVIIDSLKDVTPKQKDKDKEDLLGGTVALIPLEGKGVRINLPEILRKLKQLFQNKGQDGESK
jgi:hypothetical protein